MPNTEPDPFFLHSFQYSCPYYPTQAEPMQHSLSSIWTPWNISPILKDGEWVYEDVPTMACMEPGISYVNFVNGDPNRLFTVGCLQTMDSLTE
jgi:hypothetical protein